MSDQPVAPGEEVEGPLCPHCGADDVELASAFGPSLMTSLYRCRRCGDHFEVVRWE